jgi:putative transcriptional regulator
MENKGYEGSLKGQFLMAMPGLVDPNFHQTVTCMCEHNSQGAMGLVVNRVQNALNGTGGQPGSKCLNGQGYF